MQHGCNLLQRIVFFFVSSCICGNVNINFIEARQLLNMKKKLKYLSFLLLIMVEPVSAQVPFEKTFTFSGDNAARDVKQTHDSGFVLTGSANHVSNTSSDIFLIKTNAVGDTMWTRIFTDNGLLSGNSVIQTVDKGFVIAGTKVYSGTGLSNAYLIKTDSLGQFLWSKELNFTDLDYAHGIVQTADGGFVFSGYQISMTSNNYVAHLVKTNSIGTVLWSKTYAVNTGSNFSFSLLKTTSGGFILGGTGSDSGQDFMMIKTDSSGNLIWHKSFGDADFDENYSIAQANDGGFILAGTNYNPVSADYDITVLKTDTGGIVVWTRNYGDNGGGFNQGAYAISATQDNGYIVAGYNSSLGTNSNSWLFKVNAIGSPIWSRMTPATGFDTFYALKATSNGGCVAVGSKNRIFGSSGDIYLVRTDAAGVTPCNQHVAPLMSIVPIVQASFIHVATSASTTSDPVTTSGRGASITNLCVGDPTRNVWPGDCNYDLTVNNVDFLYIGLGYNYAGPVRAAATTNWAGQPATPWTNSFSSGVNHKHADCNGDGLVDSLDATALMLNYSLSHPLRVKPGNQLLSAGDFSLVPDRTSMGPGDTVHFSIRLANATFPIDSLYGIAFSISFDRALTDTNQISFSYIHSILGNIQSNMMSFEKNFYSSGLIDAALCRTDHINASNIHGEIGTLTMVASNAIFVISTLHLDPINVRGLTHGQTLKVFSDTASSVIIDPGVGINDISDPVLVSAFPNPVSQVLFIQSKKELISKLDLFDISGRIIYSFSPGRYSAEILMDQIESGIYTLAIEAGKKTIHKKVMVVH